MAGLLQLVGQRIQTKEGIVETESIKVEKDHIVGLYFSAHWCPPCRGFTPRLRQFYENINKSGQRLHIVFVSSDKDAENFEGYYGEMPWYAVPYDEKDLKKRLNVKCKVSGIPTLVLFDSEGNRLKTDGDVRSLVQEDNEGVNFPWPAKLTSDIVKGRLIDKDGNESSFDDLKGFTVGIYFSAHWCPPCRMFTPQLVETYNKIKGKGHQFEIVFASSDRSADTFNEYLGSMPWKAIPFGDDRKALLNRKFQVEGIPTLIILDSELNVITSDGRSAVDADKTGNSFPWHPKPVNHISVTASSLNDYSVLIHFAGKTEEEVAENGKKYLLPAAEKLGKAALPGDDTELLFCTAEETTNEGLSHRVRAFANLPDANTKPNLLVILNIPERKIYEHDAEITSADDVQRVVDDFRADKLQFREIS